MMRRRLKDEPPAGNGSAPGRWFAAVPLILAALMDLIDITIVNVALPSIRQDLAISATSLQWVVAAYLLAFAAMLMPAGHAGDIFGHRRVFLIGVAGFGLASLVCGVSGGAFWLIVGRAVQGCSAALIMPQVLAMFRTLYHGSDRSKVFALYAVIAGMASAFGVLAGGALVAANLWGLGWRAVFLVNLPIVLVVAATALPTLPKPQHRRVERLDVLPAAVLSTGMFAIVYPLLQGRVLGWPPWMWLCLGTGVVMVCGVVPLQRRGGGDRRRARSQLLPGTMFTAPGFTPGLFVALLLGAGMTGAILVLTLWLQIGQDYSPLQTGATLVAFGGGALLSGGPAMALAARAGRLVPSAGAGLLAVGTGLVFTEVHGAPAGAAIGPWQLVPGLLVAGIGMGMLAAPLIDVVLARVPDDTAGSASGVLTAIQQFGGALGVAAIGAVFFAELPDTGPQQAFTDSVVVVCAVFLLCAALALALPATTAQHGPETDSEPDHDDESRRSHETSG